MMSFVAKQKIVKRSKNDKKMKQKKDGQENREKPRKETETDKNQSGYDFRHISKCFENFHINILKYLP